jgi:hypothetical protein
MTIPPRSPFRRLAGAVLAAASLVGVLAGCSLAGPAAGLDSPNLPVTPASTSTGSIRIVLRFGNETAVATLTDTPAAREFAAMLPLDLDLRDPMGQAKSGPLPRPLDVSGTEPVFDPAVNQIYYSAPSSTFAIFYTDLGQSIPDPGLIRLGTVEAGPDQIADAGNHFTVRIDLADHPAF